MTAIAVSPDGTPMGVCGQKYWARTKRSKGKKNDRRPPMEKETQLWLDVAGRVRDVFSTTAPMTRPWFQMDRGADAWPVLLDATRSESWVTVRAAHDRRLQGTVGGEQDYLWARLGRQEPLGSYALTVPGRAGRRARTATMQLQACAVTLDLLDIRTKQRMPAPLWAVRAVEVGTTPADESPLEWLLLTTYPVNDATDAQEVLLGYAARWRIEEFHKIWKTGACDVEDTQLRARDHIERWATIHASVAMRLLRLTYCARRTPDKPATIELSRAEIDALILTRRPRGVRRGDTPTIGVAVRWLADEGGYTGKSSGGPPGALIIARGLDSIKTLARVISEGADL